ncbi:hypothetical protein ACT80S_13420 [Ramlibacter sp. MAHUQ-53]|uniref:hypothetical protein n=1 Tax=unclassified Ramlibacter TaxID=2617605 RepID=UPI003626CCC2
MSKLMTGVAIGAVATAIAGAGIWGLSAMFSKGGEAPAVTAESGTRTRATSVGNQATGVVDLICELHLDVEGQMALGIQGNEPSRITIAQVDLDKKSGWYQGKISITESRAGTLSQQGRKLVVSRPAMFERFGVMITQEQFTVDRDTGDFVQALTLNDGRSIKLIKGTCAKVTKPPF